MLKSNSKLDNRFSLIGTVCQLPKRSKSPNGIAHCQFWLEHRSEQSRKWFITPSVVKDASSSQWQSVNRKNSKHYGRQLNFLWWGFITSHKTSNGLTQLVLHAEQIEFID